MIRAAQTIENPVTSERLIFHKTSRDTDGEYVKVETIPQPGAAVAEQLIETMFGLAVDGKTSRRGVPNPLRLAVIARHHFDDVRLPVIPHALQRAALALGAPLGRALGYGATYGSPAYEPAGEAELEAAAA